MADLWKQTFSGKRFEFDAVDEFDYTLDDIAHHLSLICRYGGACRFHYSVAQHSVALAEAMWRDTGDAYLALDCLFHDAPEFVIGDIVTPLKRRNEMAMVRVIEMQIDRAIRVKMRADGIPVPNEETAKCKFYDSRIGVDERQQLMNPCEHAWSFQGPPLGVEIMRISPEDAEKLWLLAVKTFTDIATARH